MNFRTERPLECDDELLISALRSVEDSPEIRATVAHLDHCPRCQTRIGEIAAPEESWHALREVLDRGGEWGSFADEGGEEASEELDRRRALVEVAIRELAPPRHPELLGRLGRFDIERAIGSGGMGVVLKGFDSDLNRPVAIKVLAPHLATVGAARRRFAREARAAASVAHEHVVAIHSVEADHHPPYLVMQYIAGESLQCRLDREGPLDTRSALRIAVQVAAGLAAAHAQGLVHRDIKPANILLAEGTERVTITDFGLARAAADASVTCSGSIAGTPQYMSPEQARGEPVDARSDLFSLGSVIYTMLAGHPPFRADNPYGVLKRICDEGPPALAAWSSDVPPWLVTIVGKLHEKVPSARFGSAAELARVLEQCLAHLENPAGAQLPRLVLEAAVTEGLRARHRWSYVLAASGLALGMFAAIAYWGTPRPPPSREPSSPPPGTTVPLESVDASWRELDVLKEDLQETESRNQSFWEW